MDIKRKKYSNPNPKLYANFLSSLIFGWLFPLFKRGMKCKLEAKDLYNVLPEDISENLGNRLESFWVEELHISAKCKRKPKLLRAIIKSLGWSYMKYGINMFLLNMFVRVTQPLVLGNLVSHFYQGSTSTTWDAYTYTSSLIGLIILQVLLIQHANYGLSIIGMRLRIACSSLIYRKMTKLSCSSVHQVSRGSILNLLSSDVGKFDAVFMSLHYAWIVPLQAAAMACLIWQRVGVATVVGIGFMTMTTIPIQFLLGRLISRLRMRVAVMTDRRILIISELISGIRAIKMYVWERPFERFVSLTRRKEIDIIKIHSYLKGISLATLMFTNLTTLFFTLLVYVLQGNAISANTVYVITYYYYYLRLTLTYHFPNAVNFLAEASVSVRRIEKFLLLEEVQKTIVSSTSSEDNGCVLIKNVNAKWSEKSIVNTLNDINICVSPIKLYAIVGPVGAGKSSLLKLILGELRPITNSGQVCVAGSVAYASQEPWLFTGSVRSNILFGKSYREDKYREVVRACALIEDLEQLPHGDRTLVGDRGAALSGGQCARINLARAVYRNADIYLLDDPLSAVDSQVGKQLFYDCINGLLKNKTRILVTHQVQYLKEADVIIFLNNGQIEFQGTFSEFQKNDSIFHHLALDNESNHDKRTNSLTSSNGPCFQTVQHPCDEDESIKWQKDNEEPKETEELIEKKDINKSLYGKYFQAALSYFLLVATAASFVLAQALLSSSTYWIAYWTQHEDGLQLNASNVERSRKTRLVGIQNLENFDSYDALCILGGLTFASVFVCIVSNILLFRTCLEANKNIHKNMLGRLLKAPMRFFEVNPSGRILNRFSKDVGAADETLPVTMLQTVQWCSIVIGNMLQVLIVNWLMAFPLLVVLYLYSKIKDIYLATAQNIKRLESIAKSPVFSHVNTSLSGLLTIRSCGAETLLRREFDEHQDGHTAAHFLVIASSVAFGFWIDALSLVFVALVSYSFVVFGTDQDGDISAVHNSSSGYAASYVGLAITQVIGLCGSMQSCMKNYGDVVAHMTSVERMFQFTELDCEEDQAVVVGRLERPPMFWPSAGEIRFKGLSLRYSEDAEPALKDLSLSIQAGMKIGIVGRTGAGKSSLVSALLRLAKIEGSLYIDGIDTEKIDLLNLREKISIIPQEPVIFTTSVRRNLDAYGRFDDPVLWSALDAVELKAVIGSLDATLDHGGGSLSVGQRQLLCLARTILENNRILVLDEATANVDSVTDELIRATIRRQFGDCTVLTIAHRLDTILDSDRVLVMDRGRLVEFDEPSVLLAKHNGHLARLVEETGSAMAEHLRMVAVKAGRHKMKEERKEGRKM